MSAAAFLGRLCNVRPGEWPRLSLLYCMALAVLTGLTWLDAIIQAAFLQRVGVQYLPWVFISSAACSVVAFFIYTGFADRVHNTKLLIAILAVGGAGLLLGLALLGVGLVAPGYLLMYLVLNVTLFDLFGVHWATYVNAFYDIRAAKRIVPVLGTASRLAGIIGGLSMPLLNRVLSPPAIVIAGVVSLAVMAVLAAAMPRLLREPRSPLAGSSAQARQHQVQAGASSWTGSLRAYRANLREGLHQVLCSPFLRWMALSTLSLTFLMALLNYQASAIFQAQLQTTVQISNFLGLLSGIANLAVLPIQLFLLSRLIARVGLGNASLVYPSISLVMAGSLVFVPGLPTAALAYLDRAALRTAFHYPVDNLLYNAVPLRVKARTRAFASGLLVPLGTILAGILLLTPLTQTLFMPAAMLVLALAFVLAALLVRRDYGPALVALLDQEDYSSLALGSPSLQAPATLPAADAATLARLAQKLRASTSPDQAVFMARLIVEIGGEAAVPIIGQAARDEADGRLRASLVDVLAAAGVRGQGARELYAGLLADPVGQVRLAAIGGLEQVDGPHDPGYLALAARALTDPDIAVRLRVLPAMLGANDPGCRTVASTELQAMLNASDVGTRAQALRVVGQAHAAVLLPGVARGLAETADEVRLSAALAAESLAEGELSPGDRGALLAAVAALLRDPVERVRRAAVDVMSRQCREGGRDGAAAREGLAAALADPSLDVRSAAIAALVRAGQRAIPHVLEQLAAADPQERKMAAVVLARIEPHTYEPLVLGPHLTGNLRTIYRHLGCWQALAGCPGPAVAALGQALSQRNAALLDEICYLLSAVRDPAAVSSVARALRSPQPQARANAAEALESLTSSQTVTLMVPLFEPGVAVEQLLSLAERSWDMPVPTTATALRLLLTDAGDTCLRTLAAAVLAELSTAGAGDGPLSRAEAALLLGLARADPDASVRAEVGGAAGDRTARAGRQGGPGAPVLSLVAKLILVEAVPFFQGMTVDQLQVLAAAGEEVQFAAGEQIFAEGDAGGAFYVVAEGRVAIEQGTRAGSHVRLATIEAHGCFGESNLFDPTARSTAAVALQHTRTLRLRREPLLALAGRYPGISLALIDVLARQLREANDQIADLARSRPRKLHRLFDAMVE